MNSSITSLLDKYLPKGTLQAIQAEAETLLRSGASYDRHPGTQAGTVLAEDGSFEARAGKSTTASAMTLFPGGNAILSAPAGTGVVGPLLFSGKPSEVLRFSHNTIQINPAWEPLSPIYITPQQGTMDIMVLPPGATEPTPVPLSSLISQAPLFTLLVPSKPSINSIVSDALSN